MNQDAVQAQLRDSIRIPVLLILLSTGITGPKSHHELVALPERVLVSHARKSTRGDLPRYGISPR